ncbi:oxidoreductase (plasmid) [Fulvitalea axinellae]|uniref:Oxidoreductase n=1 Tax=Fulvitalea axinellae TaxID=1182444 RepID=A0AAU9CWF3_9BACT|nr:oxidoreductase [Fulvitalea axinellae]
MRLRKLGNTGLLVSPIGLGSAALGRPGYINLGHGTDYKAGRTEADMAARSEKMFRLAYQKGVRFFDTARSYGKGEAFLGHWLRTEPHVHDITVSSKWGYVYTAEWQVEAEDHEIKRHNPEVLAQQWEESKQNLGDWLDLYQIHSATLDSGVLENQEVLDGLRKIKADGMRIGLSLGGGVKQGDTLRAAMEIKDGDVPLFDTVQATWNILESSAGNALAEAHDAGMGVILKEVMANGRLTVRNEEPGFAEKREVLNELSEKYGVGPDALALATAVAMPWCDVALTGASTPEQLESNLQALQIHLSTEDLGVLLSLKESPKAYWNTRKNMAWN